MTIGDGRADLWAFLGAPLAVTLAQRVFLPVLLNWGPPPGSAEAAEERGTTTGVGGNGAGDGDNGRDGSGCDGGGGGGVSSFEGQCWRRVAVALKVIEAAWSLGALATVWRERETVGTATETAAKAGGDSTTTAPDDASGAENEDGDGGDDENGADGAEGVDVDDSGGKDPRASASRAGHPVPVPLPEGTHRFFRQLRGAFLASYFNLLMRRFVPGNTEAEKMASMVGVLQTNPLMLQFSMSGFRDILNDSRG